MLARYQITRGKRPPGNPLPEGHRIDVRMHRAHVLSPEPERVRAFLESPTQAAFECFATAYEALLQERFERDRAPFDALAEDAREHDVYIGCNCPTAKNPNVQHCHTALALRFMKKRFPKLKVVLPE